MADDNFQAVIARRQKDLNGWNERYAVQLEKTVGEHAANLKPLWKRTADSLQKRAKKLYEEAGVLNLENASPAIKEKFNHLQYESRRLDMLAKDMLNDLKQAETQQQPYFSNAIEHELENSYYMTAFGLEQAAKVSVYTPLLTKDHMLGVLANPWLPDGATYSTRLRANTAFLAQKMRGTMAEATAYGWSWNETARRIQEISGEGYFNSVRLAQTELNRASNLGASYLYMQNADILDGKTWDATLDSRTAPKDAANDGKLYDLDYDTPENPGIAGQRIPNHPHCRCRWRAKLSALDDEQRTRIARDETDNPTHFGNRTYTEAKTYREYAKEKGLPDLDERLMKDNPKRYLRPGESLADMNKEVVHYKVGRNTAAIARADWDRIQEAPKVTKPAVKPTAGKPKKEPAFVTKIKAVISGGVKSEADVRKAGGILRQEVENALAKHDKAYYATLAELDKKRNGLREIAMNLNSMNPEEFDPYALLMGMESGKSKDQAYLDAVKKAFDDLNAAEEEIYKHQFNSLAYKRADVVKAKLAELREIGLNEDEVQQWTKFSSAGVKEAVQKVQSYLPSTWSRKSLDVPMLAKSTERGYYSASSDFMKSKFKQWELEGRKLTQSSYEGAFDTICLSGSTPESRMRVGFHEMGHRMEHLIPEIKQLEHEFYARRTEGETLQWLGPGYKAAEKSRFDKFLSKYMGKDYGNSGDSYYELLSMGVESVYTNSYNLKEDKDFADFIYGILATM